MFLHADSEGSDQTRSESSPGTEAILLVWSYGGPYKSEPCSKKVLNSVSSQCARGKSSVARKTEVDPKILIGKILLKNVTLHILNLTNKIFPIWCNVKLSLLFCIFNAVKTDTKLILHRKGKYLII